MTSTDIKKPFAKSFSEIENLVDEQIRKIKEKKLSATVRASLQKILRISNSRQPGYHTRWRSRFESLPLRVLKEYLWWQKNRCTPIHRHQTVSGVNPLHTINRPSNILLSDALPFAVEPFSKVSLRHPPSSGTVANES